MNKGYYVVCRETNTVIRAQKVIDGPAGINYGETLDYGWPSNTEAWMHLHRIVQAIPSLRDKLSVECLSDRQVKEYDEKQFEMINGR